MAEPTTERYWVLRVKGRLGWEQKVFTGTKAVPLAYAAELSQANAGAPVAIFEALPCNEVTARAFASQQEADEQIAKYKGTPLVFSKDHFTKEWWKHEPWKKLIVANGDATGFVYAECNHPVPLSMEQVPMQCPACGSS